MVFKLFFSYALQVVCVLEINSLMSLSVKSVYVLGKVTSTAFVCPCRNAVRVIKPQVIRWFQFNSLRELQYGVMWLQPLHLTRMIGLQAPAAVYSIQYAGRLQHRKLAATFYFSGLLRSSVFRRNYLSPFFQQLFSCAGLSELPVRFERMLDWRNRVVSCRNVLAMFLNMLRRNLISLAHSNSEYQ